MGTDIYIKHDGCNIGSCKIGLQCNYLLIAAVMKYLKDRIKEQRQNKRKQEFSDEIPSKKRKIDDNLKKEEEEEEEKEEKEEEKDGNNNDEETSKDNTDDNNNDENDDDESDDENDEDESESLEEQVINILYCHLSSMGYYYASETGKAYTCAESMMERYKDFRTLSLVSVTKLFEIELIGLVLFIDYSWSSNSWCREEVKNIAKTFNIIFPFLSDSEESVWMNLIKDIFNSAVIQNRPVRRC